MPYYPQQDSFAYEMSTLDQTWQLLPGEELFIGEIQSNTITNPVFDTELMTSWQILDFNQHHSNGEPPIENARVTI
ncbi:uncharacterized protein EAF01_000157 [Botrytis porri]|uniref:Uncharacterized protein n=1 Tax=Botrytis porri TaxID=87229 RepID=A0A4Z1KAF3_9HELO|nr:uncharacterized protein EAF01_000157 [Botrytis porri]KAF7913751.1 hypothetical protein EAF01_000157 [Botrytis porri]TGO82987.1 hypothetical protein BPOR_0722g00030 [Botrytis porri]